MRSNQGHTKIRSKSYSNWLLIHFFDPNLHVWSIDAAISIRIWIQILILNSIYIKNWSIMFIIIDISRRFWYKWTIFDIYCHFWSIFDILSIKSIYFD